MTPCAMKQHLRLLLIIYAATLGAATAVAKSYIHVAPQGSDHAAGTLEAPFATLTRAVRQAREWRRTRDARASDTIVVALAAGATYTLDEPLRLWPEDSGTPAAPTIITTVGHGAKAIISGGTVVSGSAGSFAAPAVGGRPLLTRSLWAKTATAVSKLHLASHLGEGRMEPLLDFSPATETITIPAAALLSHGIRGIGDAPSLAITVHQRWATALLRVKDIELRGDSARLTFCNPESRWEFAHPWPQPLIGTGDGLSRTSSFSLAGARQFLDEADEWWQDYQSGTLHTADRSLTEVVVPRLNRLVTVCGTQSEPVRHIIFQGVAFQFSAWQRPLESGHVTLQGGFPITEAYKLTEHEGLPWAATLENQAWVTRPESAVSIAWGEHIDFRDCEFAHLAATALDYVEGCCDIRIERNTFSDIGGTAILAGSFLEGATEVHRPYGTTTAGRHTNLPLTERLDITRNVITDATNEDWGTVAIGCGLVRDATIEGNTVSHVNYSGICVGWGWTPTDIGMRGNRIIGNTVTDYARQLYDAGGIYTMSAQPGSLIEGNAVSAPHDAPYATNRRAFPIYFDACTDGYTVRRNTLSTTPRHPERYGYNTPGKALIIEP